MGVRLNKRLFLILVVALFLVTAPLVLSVTRTISAGYDDLSTFIVNSNGNYWEANGSYIQAAINDLGVFGPYAGGYGGPHGTVWLPANSTLVTNGTIVIEEHVTLDLQGSTIVPSGNFDGSTPSIQNTCASAFSI